MSMSRWVGMMCVVASLAMSAGSAGASELRYGIRPVATGDGWDTSRAQRIDDTGRVYGMAFASRSGVGTFIDDGGQAQLIPGVSTSTSAAVSRSGQFVGRGTYGEFQSYHAGSQGEATFDGTLPYRGTPKGVNDSGDVIGEDLSGWHAFVVRDGQQQVLKGADGAWATAEAINNAGQVAGAVVVGEELRPFRELDGQMTLMDLPAGNVNGVANDINELGQVVGGPLNRPGHAFLADDTGTIDLGSLGGTSIAFGINDVGQVVGGSNIDDLGHMHAFLYEDGRMTDLNDLLPDGSGWVLDFASDINSLGQIIGEGRYDGRAMSFVLTPGGTSSPVVEPEPVPVPEPTALAVLLAGGVGWYIRRSRAA